MSSNGRSAVELQSNGGRIAVESKSNRSCNRRLIQMCGLTYFDELLDLMFDRVEAQTEAGSDDGAAQRSRYLAGALDAHDDARWPAQLRSCQRYVDAHATHLCRLAVLVWHDAERLRLQALL